MAQSTGFIREFPAKVGTHCLEGGVWRGSFAGWENCFQGSQWLGEARGGKRSPPTPPTPHEVTAPLDPEVRVSFP
jgi:hypothetical protein